MSEFMGREPHPENCWAHEGNCARCKKFSDELGPGDLCPRCTDEII